MPNLLRPFSRYQSPKPNTLIFNATTLKTRITNPLKRRTRPKSNATKTLAYFEATITQLTNTVGDAHIFNATPPKTRITNPLKRRTSCACNPAVANEASHKAMRSSLPKALAISWTTSAVGPEIVDTSTSRLSASVHLGDTELELSAHILGTGR